VWSPVDLLSTSTFPTFRDNSDVPTNSRTESLQPPRRRNHRKLPERVQVPRQQTVGPVPAIIGYAASYPVSCIQVLGMETSPLFMNGAMFSVRRGIGTHSAHVHGAYARFMTVPLGQNTSNTCHVDLQQVW